MQVLDGGEDKVKKICETLKNKTLDPAKKEAKEIIEKALREAEKIVIRAREDAKKLFEEQKKRIDQEKSVLQASLNLACKQAIQVLKLEIEDKIFNEDLAKVIQKETQQESVIAEFIRTVVQAIDRAGLEGSLLLELPVSSKDLATKLSPGILSRFQDRIITSPDFKGGIRIKIANKRLILDMTDETIKDLLMKYIREDFRQLIFNITS